MKDSSVAARYAKALFLVTERQAPRLGVPFLELLDRTLEELRGLAAIVRHGTRVGDFLAHPQVRPADKQKVLRDGLSGRALPMVAVFADLLLRKKRLAAADDIAREFQALVERARGVQRATVVSAVPLTDGERARLQSQLERATGKTIVLAAAVDPALVGGAYVRIGDRVMDRSVRSLLQAISDQLYEASV